MSRTLSLALLIATAFSCRTMENADSELQFFGADSSRAKMTYKSYVWVALQNGITPDDLKDEQNEEYLDEIIDQQIQHMFGAFTQHPEFVDNPGIALNAGSKIYKGQPTVSILRDQISGVQNNKYARVPYTYTDEVVFHKSLLAAGPKQIEFRLPKDPLTIYKQSLMPIDDAISYYKNLSSRTRNEDKKADFEYGAEDLKHNKDMGYSQASLCTDLHYNTEGDFWYFWNPDQPGCKLTDKDMVTVKAQLDPIDSTTKTFPYYGAMYGDNGNGNKFEITYLLGIDENFRRDDLGRETFDEAAGLLRNLGFREEPSDNNRRHVLTKTRDGIDFVVTMHLVDPEKIGFVRAAKEALEKSDVFIYDGHSGLGGYLYVNRFEDELGTPLTLDPQKKQIFYFNGCSTFSYYNAGYFEKKGGSESLDVITTSIGAYFSIGARHDVKLIEHITSGRMPSWQKIMTDIYKISPDETALTHVNGDEDNPTTKTQAERSR